MPVRLEPGPDRPVLVVRRVVLDEKRARPSELPGDVLQEGAVGVRVEGRLAPIQEPGRVDFYGAQDLDAPALAGYRDVRLTADPRPRRMEGRVLPETGFVGEEERSPFPVGFFLMLGYVRRLHRSCAEGSARANTRRGR